MSGTWSPPTDPELLASRAGVPIAVVTVCLVVATTCVCLRTYARAVIIRQFGLDDWAAVAAMILAAGSGITVATNTLNGHGHHIQAVDPSRLWIYFRSFYISIVLYNASLTATKLTFLLQYQRIMGQGTMRRVIMVAFVFVALWSISQLLVVIFTCSPIHKFWLPDTPGTCIPNLPFWYINAAGNIVTDVTVFVLPLPALSRLNLRKGQKLGLIGVFSLGFFTCAISVIRIQYLKLSDDVTWDNVASSCWSIGELCSGITCACLPTLRPLIIRCLPALRSQSGRSTGDDKYYYHRSLSRGGGSKVGAGGRLHNKNSTDENGSSRGIIYPEDLELQSDDRSDKAIGVTTTTVENASVRPPPQATVRRPSASHAPAHTKYARAVDKLRLGLRPTVHTEVRVGSSGSGSGPGAWPPVMDRGIEVKRDFSILTSAHRTT
ncbi:hypothetical protein P885DRAFT_67438 [Corynascus similis CBS 632.67]